MRLRLVVRRHALPDVRVVFSCKTENDPTIANLLEQVNEIIPLESNEWGLEDYTIELRQKDTGTAFDFFHFQQVADVLKDDEEIYIRPLVTNDRRKRRLSGRDQITNDGRHLLDGIPFGRPRLRAAYSRPAVDIPPLKRPRLTYDPHGEEEDDDAQQLMITESGERGRKKARRAGSVRFSAPYDADSDEDVEDDDFGGQNVNEDESDMEPIDEDDMEEQGLDSDSDEDADLEEDVQDDESDLEAELRDLGNDMEPEKGENSITYGEERGVNARRKAKEVEAPIDSRKRGTKRPRDSNEEDDSDAESVASVIKHYDQHGFPSGSILNGTASRYMVEEMRKKGEPVNLPVHTKFEDDDDEGQNDALEEDANEASHHSSSEESGTSDSESDSGPEVASSKVCPPVPGSSEHDLTDSNPDGDDDLSRDEDENNEEAQTTADTKPSGGDDSDGHSDRDDDDDGSSNSESDNEYHDDADSDGASDGSDEGVDLAGDPKSDDDQNSSAPDSDQDSSGKSDSDEADSSDEDSDGSSIDDSNGESSDDDSSASESSSQEAASSGEDSSSDIDSSSDDDSSSDGESSSGDDTSVGQERAVPEPKKIAPSPIKTLQVTEAPAVQSEDAGPPRPGEGKPSTRKRNARRRALAQAKKADARAEALAALAPTAPSTGMTEADSTELASVTEIIAAKKAQMLERIGALTGMIVEELQGDAPSQPASAHDAAPAAQATSRLSETTVAPHKDAACDADGDPDAWRAKINYRAVECCQEGVELSEPPFPFVQRWDPQQKYQHGGRKKRKQRTKDEYQLQDEETPKTKKRRPDVGGIGDYSYDDRGPYYHEASTEYGETTLNYDDEPQEQPERSVSEVREEEEEDDLPPLPADPSTLPLLQPGSAAPGMILTWQQLLMSKATSWAPQVSRLTGIIINLEGHGVLRVRLAKRDQYLDRNEKVYDDEGKRVYDKFELPGMDEEDEEEEEEGYRTLDLSEMMEPRVLQYPSQIVPGTPLVEEPSPSHTANNLEKTTSAQTSATLGHEAPEQSTDETSQVDINTQTLEESVIPESCDPNGSSEDQEAQAAQVMSVEDISMTEDRRHEISQLISEAGFRKEVDPSIANDALSNRSSHSPSRQLTGMSHDALPRPFESSQPQSDLGSRRASRGTTNGVDSRPIWLEPFNGFSDAISLPPSKHRVESPKLALPPSEIGSIQNERQVDPYFSIDLADSSLNALEDDSANRDALRSSPPYAMEDEPSEVESHEEDEQSEDEQAEEEDNVPTPRPSRLARAVSESSSSDESLPSVSELCTQPSTNNSSGVPARDPVQVDVIPLGKSRMSKTTADAEYEEAMRRLDDMEGESEDSNDSGKSDSDDGDSSSDSDIPNVRRGPSTLARRLMVKPIEKPSPRKSQHLKQSSMAKIKMEPVSSHTETCRRRSARTSAQFQVPKRSQVISLLSSPEPALEENYAEDDIDETYKDSQDSDWPDGDGWVKRRPTSAARRVSLSKRGMSVPASSLGLLREKASVPQRIASSQQPDSASSQGLARARKRIADGLFHK
ncbi:hypothetical protein QC764_213820 [Podospora pseudoanserina]|uniref:DUF7357 domain-containing protein n=1 Tax=Podospora pseudoanserina TaxID=2609844 RepID=A0ABR0IKZ6_9PEZI|nr:hypothetical protein QC764_213820 [Podospora pseudoanserina]